MLKTDTFTRNEPDTDSKTSIYLALPPREIHSDFIDVYGFMDDEEFEIKLLPNNQVIFVDMFGNEISTMEQLKSMGIKSVSVKARYIIKVE